MSIRIQATIMAVLLSVAACDPGNVTEGGSKVRLTATERSATTLKLQWDAMGATTQYTVDYFTGPGYTTCDFPQTHSDVLHMTGTAGTITGLLPSRCIRSTCTICQVTTRAQTSFWSVRLRPGPRHSPSLSLTTQSASS